MISYFEFEKYFSAIAKKFITEPEFYEYFMKFGFDPSGWPDCDGRRFGVEFASLVRAKSVEHAKLHLRKKSQQLGDYDLPNNSKEIITQFEEMKTFGIWKQAAEQMLKNPFEAQEIISVANKKSMGSLETTVVQDVIEQYTIDHFMKIQSGQDVVTKINNWPILSKQIGGFNPARIFLVVAETGVGKTTLTLNLTLDALSTMNVLFVNMEMSESEMLDRIIQIGTKTKSDEWKGQNGIPDPNKTAEFVKKLKTQGKFYLTNGRALSVDQISNLIFSHKENKNIDLVIIDYDQKIRSNYRGEEWQTIQKAIEELEEVAKITMLPIIILAQGDENNDPKASKRSKQSASAVLSFYRDENLGKYFLTSKKNRFGPKFTLEMDCDLSIYKINEKHLHDTGLVVPKTVNRGMR